MLISCLGEGSWQSTTTRGPSESHTTTTTRGKFKYYCVNSNFRINSSVYFEMNKCNRFF